MEIEEGDETVKDPIIESETECEGDEYNVLCNYPLGPNEAGYEYLKMIKERMMTHIMTHCYY